MNTKDIQEIVGEFENALVFKDWPNKNVKGAGNWLRTTLTTLTQHHQAEVERRVEAERERIVKHFSQYLREWQDGMEDNSPTVKISWVIDQLLAPTKTDK